MLKRVNFARRLRFLAVSGQRSHETTHFGAQTVKKEEKQGKVNEVFTNVADTYVSFEKLTFWRKTKLVLFILKCSGKFK